MRGRLRPEQMGLALSRAQRLLDLIQLLRRHRRPVSGAIMADELGVSLRTLYRDIETLKGQGARIDGEPGLGFVSRVTPVHTAMRNCTRDEGRSFEFGNQVLISSHRKLLSSKAMVVNVAEKSGHDPVRHG
jgi:predicted DNA-binding transcriptional regulator YafY